MTDREMAVAIGRHIIKMQLQIKMLEDTLTKHLPDDLYQPVAQQRPELAHGDLDPENHASQVTESQLDGLLLNIAAETQDSGLIRALHNQFLSGNVLEDQ